MIVSKKIICNILNLFIFVFFSILIKLVKAKRYDVVVYDATSGGVMAAISSARKNLNTILICSSWPSCFEEGGFVIGGMSSGGLGQTDIGQTYPYIGGLAKEFYYRNHQFYIKNAKNKVKDTSGANCRLPTTSCNETFNLEPHVAQYIFKEMVDEAGVKIIYSAQILSVTMDGNRIQSITMTNDLKIDGKIFLDASYEGDLMAAANVSYTTGREGREKYNESLAGMSGGSKKNQFNLKVNPYDNDGKPLPFITKELPSSSSQYNKQTDKEKVGSGDNIIQSYNFRLCLTKNKSNLVPFSKPSNYNRNDWELLKRYVNACKDNPDKCQIGFPSCNLGILPNSKVDMNNCGGFSSDLIGGSLHYPLADYETRKKIWYDHLNYQQGLLYFLSTDPSIPLDIRNEMNDWGLCADEFNQNKLAKNWPPALYVRGARRMIGSQIFTQNTPAKQRMNDGNIGNLSICIGGYNFDSHNGQRIACKNTSSCYNLEPSPNTLNNNNNVKMARNDDDDMPFAWDEGDVEINPGLYQIPYWILIPKLNEVNNLLNIATPSASHIGMSTLRMEPQFMMLGHAAGTASYVAIQSDENVMPVQKIDLNRLNKLLLEEDMILNV